MRIIVVYLALMFAVFGGIVACVAPRAGGTIIVDSSDGVVSVGASLPSWKDGPVPPYPNWPPETPSSTMRLTPMLFDYGGTSLFEMGDKIAKGLIYAGYSDFSFYSAPGGFVVVTRIEAMKADGSPILGRERFQLPTEMTHINLSLVERIRNLFLNAPPGYYLIV